ncbi:hypothetical protein [Sphingobium aromaticivastans]|uniref:hypothetical protein n=1 Tax=Sphingobium aromaticivastans TaxID=1778665 RepID=UPI00301911FA
MITQSMAVQWSISGSINPIGSSEMPRALPGTRFAQLNQLLRRFPSQRPNVRIGVPPHIVSDFPQALDFLLFIDSQ